MVDSFRVLVVDDEANIRMTLSVCLESLGCAVDAAAGAPEAVTMVERRTFDLAFIDVRLGSADGLALLPKLLRASPGLAVVMITAYASIGSAVDAIRGGAYDYLPKPFTPAQIRHIVARFQERRELQNRLFELEERITESVPEVLLETDCRAMRTLLETITRAAPTDSAVLLRGESGTGKGVLARLLHTSSQRASRRLVTVNCPTLTDEFLVSALFGHVQDAFVGAVGDQRGKVEDANAGTLFLDEIGEVSPALQAKLLRFLQDKGFERVGETRTRHSDVRIVAATHRDLDADVAAGRFRPDLLYRLNVIELEVPPLRHRLEDLPALIRHFLHFHATSLGRPVPELAPEAEAVLLAYGWPGNLRELRNEMERAVVLSRGSVLLPESFSERIRRDLAPVPRLGGDFSLRQIEREHTLGVLERASTREEAARTLGIDPSTLWRRLRRWEEG